MASARMAEECVIPIINQTGAGAKALECLEKAGVNLSGFVGYSISAEQAFIHIVADAMDQAFNALTKAGYECQRGKVVLVEVPNVPGGVAKVLRKLAGAGVDVEHCWASALGSGSALCVFRAKDNAGALKALQG